MDLMFLPMNDAKVLKMSSVASGDSKAGKGDEKEEGVDVKKNATKPILFVDHLESSLSEVLNVVPESQIDVDRVDFCGV